MLISAHVPTGNCVFYNSDGQRQSSWKGWNGAIRIIRSPITLFRSFHGSGIESIYSGTNMYSRYEDFSSCTVAYPGWRMLTFPSGCIHEEKLLFNCAYPCLPLKTLATSAPLEPRDRWDAARGRGTGRVFRRPWKYSPWAASFSLTGTQPLY